MHAVIAALARHAASRPAHPALSDGNHSIPYAGVYAAVTRAALGMRGTGAATVALALDNGPAWLILDLATLAARLRCVPVPGFFSAGQQTHLMADAGAGLLITDRPAHYAELLAGSGLPFTRLTPIDIAGARVARFLIQHDAHGVPVHTAKITYTSGTTGAPKGACLDGNALARVAHSLMQAVGLRADDRHLSLLPLATLLENVGVYATLLAGGTCIAPALAAVGMRGAAELDCDRLVAQLAASGATTAIVTPELLRGTLDRIEAGGPRPEALRFLAVGGAPLPGALLDRAAACAVPAYQGYGLSECGSVVTLNTPAGWRHGSVGRPLPHARITIAEDGEIHVAGATLLGYCGTTDRPSDPWPTGDVGRLDEGYLYLTGRKKNIFITAFGRNVSPEWVEAELTAVPAIRQAWVHGEARPWNSAVITAAERCGRDEVNAAVERVNQALPDYARITRWIFSERAFSFAGGELTANGRLRRETLVARYGARLDQLYLEHSNHVL